MFDSTAVLLNSREKVFWLKSEENLIEQVLLFWYNKPIL